MRSVTSGFCFACVLTHVRFWCSALFTGHYSSALFTGVQRDEYATWFAWNQVWFVGCAYIGVCVLVVELEMPKAFGLVGNSAWVWLGCHLGLTHGLGCLGVLTLAWPASLGLPLILLGLLFLLLPASHLLSSPKP